MKAPCLDCEERHLGCHSECERYKTFKDERESTNEQIRKERETANDFKMYREATYDRLRRASRRDI